MVSFRPFWSPWAAGLLALATSGVRADFIITDLDTLPGGTRSQGRGVNAGGVVAGSSDVADGSTHAFAGTEDGLSDLGTLDGGLNSAAFAISDTGFVAGSSQSGPAGATHAVRGSVSGGLVDLGTLGGDFAEGLGINNAGVVVGRSRLGSGLIHAFRSTGGGLQDLGTLTGGFESRANGINDAGLIVGSSTTATGHSHAVLFGPLGVIADLGTLPGGLNSFGEGINGFGDVVGSADDASGVFHAVRRRAGASAFDDLGTLPGGTSHFAFGINDAGLIVGEALVGGGASRAFLWEESTGMVDLNSLIAPGSGWVLTSARSIGDGGHITGFGTINGEVHAFLLSPPSVPGPPAIVLLMIGALGTRVVAGRARRRLTPG